MKEYLFSGSVVLRGVTFFIKAKNKNEAIGRARVGDYDDCQTGMADYQDWVIDPKTCEENK